MLPSTRHPSTSPVLRREIGEGSVSAISPQPSAISAKGAPGFNSHAKVKSIPNGDWAMLAPLGYTITDPGLQQATAIFFHRYGGQMPPVMSYEGNTLTVQKGFHHDFASVPRIFWTFLKPTEIREPSIPHDAWYHILKALWWATQITDQDFRRFRRTADLIFKESMPHMRPRIPKWKQAAAYRAVRLFGWYDTDMQAAKRPRRQILRRSRNR